MRMLKIALGSLIASAGSGAALADAPRGSSYADDKAPDDAPLPTQTLVEGSTKDLTVRQLPTTDMKMRAKAKPVDQKKAKKSVAAGAGAGAGAGAADSADSGGSVGYKAFPTSTRDLRERVTFRIRAGTEIDSAPASGETLRGGQPLPDGFTDTRPFILGDAIIGARGIGTPTLNGYFLGSFAFDASDSLATRAATIMPYDSEHVAIKAGYAEYGRDDRKPDGQQPNKFWIRAGRQFRLDGGNLFAYFDGATIGYREKDWDVSGFAGQRVALYVDTEPGIVFGATAGYHKAALSLGLDYMGLAIKSTDFDGVVDADGNTANDGETRHLIELHGKYKVNKMTTIDGRARLTGLPDVAGTAPGEIPADKFALGRIGGRIRYEANRIIVIGDLEQRFKDDIAYDLASASQADIVDVANKVGVLATPVNAIRVGAQVDWQTPNKKTEVFGLVKAEKADGDDPTTVDNRDYVEVGLGLAGTPIGVRGSGVYMTAAYTLRQFTNLGKDGDMRVDGVCNDLTDANMDGIPDNCQAFDNTASSGIDQMHQLAGEAVMTTKAQNGKHWRFGVGAFFRVFNFSTPYREVKNDARGGGLLDVQYWLNRDLHINVNGEFAQTSPTLTRDISSLTSFRAALEARW